MKRRGGRSCGHDRQQRLGELGRVAGLPAVLALPELALGSVALGVVLDRRRRVVRRLLREQLGAEEARVDDRRVDAERLDLGGERLHPALHAELRRGVGGCSTRSRPARPTRRSSRRAPSAARASRAGRRGSRSSGRSGVVASWRSICSGVSSSKKPARKLAALLTSTSMAPKRSIAAVTAASASSSAGDVELDDQQALRVAEGAADGLGVATGGDDVVAGRERRPCEVGAHAAAGAGDEPGLDRHVMLLDAPGCDASVIDSNTDSSVVIEIIYGSATPDGVPGGGPRAARSRGPPRTCRSPSRRCRTRSRSWRPRSASACSTATAAAPGCA